MNENIPKACPTCISDDVGNQNVQMIKIEDRWYCTMCNYSERDA